MSFGEKWKDNVKIVLTSADIHGALHAIAVQNIEVYEVDYLDALRICFVVHGKYLPVLNALTEKRGEYIEIKKHVGIVDALSRICKRPILILGFMGIFLLACWVSTRVFFVRIEGNNTIPTKQIMEQAMLCGIDFGARRRDVRSENMKNALLEAMPGLQWAGINTYGCCAVITVRERNDLQSAEDNTNLSSIVALRDGVIRDMTVQQGNALCQVGQAVKAGQTLVSGYTDCGIYIRATGAKAEIYGETQRSFCGIAPTEYSCRVNILKNSKKYSLILGKKRINFFKGSGISGSTCAKIYAEKYVTLPGGFVLPIGIICEQTVEYDVSSALAGSVESMLLPFAESYLKSLMQAGQIVQSDHVYTQTDRFCRLDGLFSCYEMIGITRPEEAIKEYE